MVPVEVVQVRFQQALLEFGLGLQQIVVFILVFIFTALFHVAGSLFLVGNVARTDDSSHNGVDSGSIQHLRRCLVYLYLEIKTLEATVIVD